LVSFASISHNPLERRKNIIRRSGENIAAVEVEAVLQTHAAVAQAAVLAVKDEVRSARAPGKQVHSLLFFWRSKRVDCQTPGGECARPS